MFCHDKDGIAYMMFNKQLTPEKYEEIYKKISGSISGSINTLFEKVAWTNHTEVMEALENDKSICHGKKLEVIHNYKTRKGAWRPVREKLLTLRNLDIWDEEANKCVEIITGWNLDEEAKKTSV